MPTGFRFSHPDVSLSKSVVANTNAGIYVIMLSPQDDGSIVSVRYPVLAWVVEYDDECEAIIVRPVTWDSRTEWWCLECEDEQPGGSRSVRYDFVDDRSFDTLADAETYVAECVSARRTINERRAQP